MRQRIAYQGEHDGRWPMGRDLHAIAFPTWLIAWSWLVGLSFTRSARDVRGLTGPALLGHELAALRTQGHRPV